jgi:hypothetical protein
LSALPHFLVDALRNPPRAGEGVNLWLFKTARQLHAHMEPAMVAARLKAATAWCGRRVLDSEISRAVERSAACAWKPHAGYERPHVPAGVVTDEPTEPWPQPHDYSRQLALLDGRGDGVDSLDALWDRSPSRMEEAGTDEVLDMLFPAAPVGAFGGKLWLCLAKAHPRDAVTAVRSHWEFIAGEHAFIVPSPMLRALGVTQGGRPSTRSLSNTGPRTYVVVECDQGDFDDHAAFLWHLDRASIAAGGPRLCLAVQSGGKSLHGWFACAGMDEATLRPWFAYAVLCGADPATWTRCQLVRVPGGTRDTGARQPIVFCDPSLMWTPQLSTTPSAPSGSLPVTPLPDSPPGAQGARRG